MSKKNILLSLIAIILIVYGGYMIFKNNSLFSKFLNDKYSVKNKGITGSTKNNKLSEDVIDIVINIDGKDIKASLYNTETALEFMSHLPIDDDMEDISNRGKNYYFNEAFITDSSVINPVQKGDLMIYSNNCFTIFYKKHHNITYSYTRIGYINNPDDLDKVIKKGESQHIKISIAQ